MSKEISEIVIIVLAGTFLMSVLVVFLFSFFIIHQRRQQKHIQEKAALKAQYDQEILQSQIEVQNQTLAYIGRELHDNVGQLLSVTKINLNVMAENLATNDQDFTENFQQAQQLVGEIINEVRGLSKSLDGNFVEEFGLAESITNELQRIRKTRKFNTDFAVEGEKYALGFQREIILFRIVQEVLNNAMKHAEAKNLSVILNYQPQVFELIISDDGKGFDVQLAHNQALSESGAGLRSIQKRAKLIGDECTFESEIGKGTSVKIILNNH